MKKFRCALAGLAYAWRTQINMRIHTLAALVVALAGVYFRLAAWEWAAILLAIALVVVAEVMNTAIELAVDLKVREQHPLARAAKDTAAGAVLLAALAAVAIGALVFGPRLVGWR